MPATLLAPQPGPSAAFTENVCLDCLGTGVDSDSDGSLTGTVGAPVLCWCSGGLDLETNIARFGVCDDCGGTGLDVDSDGSQSGTIGTIVVCGCSGGAR
ncbi:hypothetical protein [Streptomyces sp. B27]|uniref:hypothetical protein n=1 Tax=Streptomyces sp. B27 TaxID=2485015 RepID=UPI000FD9E828|nr:hypothetical protein [Streptomyces sp. B27]